MWSSVSEQFTVQVVIVQEHENGNASYPEVQPGQGSMENDLLLLLLHSSLHSC